MTITTSGGYERPHTGKDVLATLQEAGKYSMFLSLADRAGVTGILRGSEHDSSMTEVSFRTDRTRISLSSSNVKITGFPAGVDVENLKSSFLDKAADAIAQSRLEDDAITVFAPTDSAFAALPKPTMDSLQLNADMLRTFVRGHILNKGLPQSGLATVETMQMMNGVTVPVQASTAGAIKVAKGTVQKPVPSDNGYVYGIDRIIH
jgi:hypothetical protein